MSAFKAINPQHPQVNIKWTQPAMSAFDGHHFIQRCTNDGKFIHGPATDTNQLGGNERANELIRYKLMKPRQIEYNVPD